MPVVKRKEIRLRRQRTGMKLGAFAKYAGVSYHTLKNVESGYHNPSIEVVYLLADALRCDAEELLGEDEPEPNGVAA